MLSSLLQIVSALANWSAHRNLQRGQHGSRLGRGGCPSGGLATCSQILGTQAAERGLCELPTRRTFSGETREAESVFRPWGGSWDRKYTLKIPCEEPGRMVQGQGVNRPGVFRALSCSPSHVVAGLVQRCSALGGTWSKSVKLREFLT